jgi:putative CocE/NonD family hydrolase
MDDIVRWNLRWFDHHLKGINNGVADEPSIYYYTFNAPAGKEWQFASQWPLNNQKMTKYYLAIGPTKTSASTNDGGLAVFPPTASGAKDEYTTDYSIKVFEKDGADLFKENERTWNGDMEKSTNSKGLTFQRRLTNLLITGIPVIHLWYLRLQKTGISSPF